MPPVNCSLLITYTLRCRKTHFRQPLIRGLCENICQLALHKYIGHRAQVAANLSGTIFADRFAPLSFHVFSDIVKIPRTPARTRQTMVMSWRAARH